MPGEALAEQAVDTHHHLLAHGQAVELFRDMGLPGRIGIALNLSPVYAPSEGPKDVAAARLEDGILNRWFLDAVLRGSYPEDVLSRYRAAGLAADLEEISSLARVPPDFIGVNYYAPRRVRHRPGSHRFGIEVLADPDTVTSVLGEVYPEGLYDLLTRLSRDYGSARLIVTENGCGFGPADEGVVEGRIHDRLRVRYLKDHLRQVHRAPGGGRPGGRLHRLVGLRSLRVHRGVQPPLRADPRRLRQPGAAVEGERLRLSGDRHAAPAASLTAASHGHGRTDRLPGGPWRRRP